MIVAAIHESFDKHFDPLHFGPLPPLQLPQSLHEHSTPPAPQARKEEVKKPLYEATVEDDAETNAESTAEKQIRQQHSSSKCGNSMPANKSTLSKIPRLCTTPTSGDPAACLSNALLLACQHDTFLGSLFGCIRCMEGMEASGEG